MLAVGEQLWGEAPEALMRVADAFGGGIAGTHEDLCGVFSAAVILAGAEYGRADHTADDKAFWAAFTPLRERFLTIAKYMRCDDARNVYPDAPKRCRPLVEEGARMIMDWFEQQEASKQTV